MSSTRQPIGLGQEKAARQAPAWFLAAFCSVFGFAGAAVLWFTALHPFIRSQEAKQWVSTPAKIRFSEVARHSDSDGDTFRVEVVFEYIFQGQPYSSSTYGFQKASSSGQGEKQRIVSGLPPGKEVTCFVNPARPEEAVLDRSTGGLALFGTLFSIPFITVGLVPLFVRRTVRNGAPTYERRWGRRADDGLRQWQETEEKGGREALLKPTSSRTAMLLGTVFVFLFWNGIVSVFVAIFISGFRKGAHPEWFLGLFLLPFVAVGLFFGFALLWQLLALAHPVVRVSLGKAPVRLGDDLQVSWEITGRSSILRDLTATLRGVEVAKYQRGTDTQTDRSVFHREQVFSTQDVGEIRAGSAPLHIPAESMHSFDGGNNQVKWTLVFTGTIAYYPDLRQSYLLDVHPLPAFAPAAPRAV